MKILIYGFGRMGLTHFSILNTLNDDITFTIVEPNKVLRKILNKGVTAKNGGVLRKNFDRSFGIINKDEKVPDMLHKIYIVGDLKVIQTSIENKYIDNSDFIFYYNLDDTPFSYTFNINEFTNLPNLIKKIDITNNNHRYIVKIYLRNVDFKKGIFKLEFRDITSNTLMLEYK